MSRVYIVYLQSTGIYIYGVVAFSRRYRLVYSNQTFIYLFIIILDLLYYSVTLYNYNSIHKLYYRYTSTHPLRDYSHSHLANLPVQIEYVHTYQTIII